MLSVSSPYPFIVSRTFYAWDYQLNLLYVVGPCGDRLGATTRYPPPPAPSRD